MIRTTLIGAVPVGAIAAAAIFKPALLAIAGAVFFVGFFCFGFGLMIEDLFCDD